MEFAAREMEHIIRLVTGQPLLASSKSCQLLKSVIFLGGKEEPSRRLRSGAVVEEGLVKLFFTKGAKMFAKDIPCHIPLFSTTLISYHHVVKCFRLARFEAGSILKGKRIKTTRCR